MFVERRINQKNGVVELWSCRWENAKGKQAKKVFLNKLCDEKHAEADAEGAQAETVAVCWANDRTMGNIAVSSPEFLGHFPAKSGTDAILPCNFVEAGKFRMGTIRMWCTTHQSHWGVKADVQAFQESGVLRCASHAEPMNYVVSPYVINLEKFAEIGIWCSMPAALSTREIKARPPKIHVHVRDKKDGMKLVDRDFPAVSILYAKGLDLFANDSISRVNVTPPAGFEFVKGLELNREMDCIACHDCGFPHLDMGDFADKPHRKHFCGNCGRDNTWSSKPIVSTPLKPLHDKCAKTLQYVTPGRELCLDDYAGCDYAVWASTPAIVWTAERPQELGIHVHVHDGKTRIVDETFGRVTLKGKELDRSDLVNTMMAKTLA